MIIKGKEEEIVDVVKPYKQAHRWSRMVYALIPSLVAKKTL